MPAANKQIVSAVILKTDVKRLDRLAKGQELTRSAYLEQLIRKTLNEAETN